MEDYTTFNMTNYCGTKKRGTRLLSVPRIEALALPNPVEQTTPESTPI